MSDFADWLPFFRATLDSIPERNQLRGLTVAVRGADALPQAAVITLLHAAGAKPVTGSSASYDAPLQMIGKGMRAPTRGSCLSEQQLLELICAECEPDGERPLLRAMVGRRLPPLKA